MKKIFLALVLVFICCGPISAQKKHSHKHRVSRKKKFEKNEIKYGTASFYANKFNGRSTANDEIYDGSKYTAACNVLPLNTWIKVTNLRNNRSVVVKINDRMNAKNKRLVDLSKIAARQLGFHGRGLTHVKVEVLKNYKP